MNLNNPLLGNQAIKQMIQDMVPRVRRIGRPVYHRPYPEHFDQEEFSRGFKVSDFALFSRGGLSRPWSILADSWLNVLKSDIMRP